MMQNPNLVWRGFEPLSEGSRELRYLALFPVESPLAPEGTLVVACVERCQESQAQREGYTPEQHAELLCELAEEIFRQAIAHRDQLSTLGHRTQASQPLAAPCPSG